MTNLDKKIDSAIEDINRGAYRSAGRTSLQRFGTRLKHWREDRGYSRSALVKEVEERGIPCSSSNLSYWESGKRMPTPDTIDVLCEVLQISGAHLFGPDGDIRDTVISVYEVINELPEANRLALQQLYQKQRDRRETQKRETERQQREDAKELKKILGV